MAHTFLSPSAASQWLSCTPSMRMQELVTKKLPAEEGLELAEEGTHAHAWCELQLKQHFGLISDSDYADQENTLFLSDYHSEELMAYCSVYVDFVKTQSGYEQEIVLIETSIDLSEYAPLSRGTVDFAMVRDKTLYITDLKYGAYVSITAIENKQLQLYALGVYEKVKSVYEIEKVYLSIIQPRTDNITEYEIPIAKLLIWGTEILKPLAWQAFTGSGAFVTGKHCLYCQAQSICATYKNELYGITGQLEDVQTLNNDELAAIMDKEKAILSWLKRVREYVTALLEKGEKVGGYKFVLSKSVRKFTDLEAVEDTLRKLGYNDEEMFKPKALIALTAIEKSVGKKDFFKEFNAYIVKTPQYKIIADGTDKRPEADVTFINYSLPNTDAIDVFDSVINQ